MVYEGISLLSYSMCCFIVNEEMKLEYLLFLPSWYFVARITRVFCVINVIMMDFQGLSYLKCHPSNTVAWVFCCVAWVLGFVTTGDGFSGFSVEEEKFVTRVHIEREKKDRERETWLNSPKLSLIILELILYSCCCQLIINDCLHDEHE